jgi:hypothetical protein
LTTLAHLHLAHGVYVRKELATHLDVLPSFSPFEEELAASAFQNVAHIHLHVVLGVAARVDASPHLFDVSFVNLIHAPLFAARAYRGSRGTVDKEETDGLGGEVQLGLREAGEGHEVHL